jgi:ABC-2 family transporter
MFDLRLISADFLKLRRRRGMLAVAIALTIGTVVLAFTVMAIQHAGNPDTHGPAGGLVNFQDAIGFETLMAIVAGVIVGTTAGAQDLESGVFRDLVATGRSRLELFGARVPAAWAILVPICTVTAAITGVASVALAGSLATPGAVALIAGTIAVITAGALSAAVAVGLSALVGSRGPVIAIMLAFSLVIQDVLQHVSFLGNVREALPVIALNRIADLPPREQLNPAIWLAVAVVVAWAAVALGIGAWRTRTSEI